jgi:hypothetical protein
MRLCWRAPTQTLARQELSPCDVADRALDVLAPFFITDKVAIATNFCVPMLWQARIALSSHFASFPCFNFFYLYERLMSLARHRSNSLCLIVHSTCLCPLCVPIQPSDSSINTTRPSRQHLVLAQSVISISSITSIPSIQCLSPPDPPIQSPPDPRERRQKRSPE